MKQIVCDKCGKKLKEDDLRAEVTFEGHMMVRESLQFCIECWDKGSLQTFVDEKRENP